MEELDTPRTVNTLAPLKPAKKSEISFYPKFSIYELLKMKKKIVLALN